MNEDPKHLNSFIHRIIELLKKEDRAYTFQEIYTALGINVLSNSPLVKALRNNPKIAMNRETLRFVPLYNVRSVSDLRSIMAAAAGCEGIELAKLADSPVNIAPFVAALRAEGTVVVLRDLDGSEILFCDDTPVAPARPEIRAMWAAVPIPSYHDIVGELSTAGLKSAYGQVAKKRAVVKKEPRKRSQRRIKVTNTHVKGLDLTGMNDSE